MAKRLIQFSLKGRRKGQENRGPGRGERDVFGKRGRGERGVNTLSKRGRS